MQQNVLQMINVSEVLMIQFLLQSSAEYGIGQIEVLTTRQQVFLASINSSAQKTVTRVVYGELSF